MTPRKDGVFVEPTNEDRARWALSALAHYSKQTRNDAEIPIDHDDEDGTELLEEVAADLLCDLMHLLSKHGVDPADPIDRAYVHFSEEREEEA